MHPWLPNGEVPSASIPLRPRGNVGLIEPTLTNSFDPHGLLWRSSGQGWLPAIKFLSIPVDAQVFLWFPIGWGVQPS